MLKGIPAILSPELLKILDEMGHGDEIVLADGNFPAESVGQRVVHCEMCGALPLLKAILRLFPLDAFVSAPCALMEVASVDRYTPEIWPAYREAIQTAEGRAVEIEMMERFAFYERAKKAYAVIATGERARYANIILKKGIIETGEEL